jgi:ABC-type Fe3+-hydroxamate transport system substrate-binding protein
MRTLLVVGAILLAAVACGEMSSSPSSSGSSKYISGAPAQAPAPGKPGTAPGSTDIGALTPDQVAVQGPKVIRQAQLTVSVASGSFDKRLADVRALVERENGFIAGTDAQANPQTNEQIRTGVVTFMVPADKFDETIDQLATLGKVQNEHISGQDVSAQYVDLQARLGNEMAQRDAMLALLRRAQSISDIIAVQTQLGQITQQIEELKGQIAYLDHNTSYSTVTVSIVEAGAATTPQASDSWGFVTALSDSAHNFVTTINYMVTGLGAIGPVVLLLGLGYLVWRRSGSPWPKVRSRV